MLSAGGAISRDCKDFMAGLPGHATPRFDNPQLVSFRNTGKFDLIFHNPFRRTDTARCRFLAHRCSEANGKTIRIEHPQVFEPIGDRRVRTQRSVTVLLVVDVPGVWVSLQYFQPGYQTDVVDQPG